MEYRQLGKTGLRVSELCLGTMQFGWTSDEEVSYQILDTSFESGINFLDTADIYSTWAEGNPGGVAETIIGRWLKKSSIPRDQIVIATKVRGRMGNGANDEGLSRVHIFNAVESSLKRLNCDYIDLYQTHWYDENTPIEETLGAMTDLIQQGKVRYLGCSNYPAWRLIESLWAAERYNLSRFDSIQPHYHLVRRDEFERELAEVCRKYQIGVIPYSPLAGGFLTGKYRGGQSKESARHRNVQKYFTDKNWDLLEQLQAIADNKGDFSISQVAIAWLLSNPLITSPIIGPRTLDQLNDNLGAVGLRLSHDEMQALNAATS